MKPNCAASRHCPLIILLMLSAALAGCGGLPGWVRLQLGPAGPRDEVLFETVSAATPPAPDREVAPRPLVLQAEDVKYNLNDEPIRSRWLLALIEPTEAADKVQLIAVVGKAERRAAPTWQLYVGRKDVGFWRYAQRTMLVGQVSPPAGMGYQTDLEVAACLRPAVSKAAFSDGVTEMLERLERLRARSPYAGASEPAGLKETVEHLRQIVGQKAADAAAARAKLVAQPVATAKAPADVKKPAPERPKANVTKPAPERSKVVQRTPPEKPRGSQKPEAAQPLEKNPVKAREPVLPPAPTQPKRPDQPLDPRVYF